MSKLDKIKAATEVLTPEEKQELMLFLAIRLRKGSVKLPEPRKFSKRQIAAWVCADDADMAHFKLGE